MLAQFDVVEITSTKRARWLFTERGDIVGQWTVVSVFADDLIVSKDRMLLRIPIDDVRKVAAYNLDAMLHYMKHGATNYRRATNGEPEREESESGEGS